MSEGLSVIVCILNGEVRVEQFVRPLWDLLRSASFSAELVVVDDGSTDGTAAAARKLAPEVHVLCHEDNRGLPAARNTAVLAARHQWLLFCDDDLEVSRSTLEQLWETRRVDACTVPELRGVAGELQNSMTSAWRLLDLKFDYLATPIDEVSFPVGACFLINRQTLLRASGFDQRFRLYYEDANFGAALRQLKVPVIMLEGTCAVHHLHGSGAVSKARHTRISRDVYQARWRYALSLRGWRRVMMLIGGLPRTCHESVVKRSPDPLMGYFRALRDAPLMVRSRARYDLRSRLDDRS
jgi:glycosyltransferase involved in cell wall biosynthesis